MPMMLLTGPSTASGIEPPDLVENTIPRRGGGGGGRRFRPGNGRGGGARVAPLTTPQKLCEVVESDSDAKNANETPALSSFYRLPSASLERKEFALEACRVSDDNTTSEDDEDDDYSNASTTSHTRSVDDEPLAGTRVCDVAVKSCETPPPPETPPAPVICRALSPTNRTPPAPPALKSALRRGCAQETGHKHFPTSAGKTKRRVRGLWNSDDNSCLFANLHDELLVFIFSFLGMWDLCAVSRVCRRWSYVANLDQCWNDVHATDFVLRAHDRVSATASPAAAVSEALQERLRGRSPEKLSIRSVEHRLSADTYLPSVRSLKELTIQGYADLTDTHVHVMLLSAAVVDVQSRSQGSCMLRALRLEDCPLLTGNCLRSIAERCHDLEELSLRGNRLVVDVSALKDCWMVQESALAAAAAAAMAGGGAGMANLQSFFAPPPLSAPPSTPVRRPGFASALAIATASAPVAAVAAAAPASPPPSSTTTGLASLFAPPSGRSPPPVRRNSSFSSRQPQGRLARIDLSNTGVAPRQLLSSLEEALDDRGASAVHLESLAMRGSGEAWRDGDLRRLSRAIDATELRRFDIGCANAWRSSSSSLKGKGLVTMFAKKKNNRPSLQRLCLAGHGSIGGLSVAEILSVATDLVELDLEGCPGIGSSVCGDDVSAAEAIASSLVALGGNLGGGLVRLSLARCFPNTRDTASVGSCESEGCDDGSEDSREGIGLVVDALCRGPSRRTLEELDLSGCGSLSAVDVIRIRDSCKRLRVLRFDGTRYRSAKAQADGDSCSSTTH